MIREREGVKGMEEAKQFAERYVALAVGKRLGNVLVDDAKPEESDWERRRYDMLSELVGEEKEDTKGWEDRELWDSERKVTDKHLKLIGWAWSPIGERKLP